MANMPSWFSYVVGMSITVVLLSLGIAAFSGALPIFDLVNARNADIYRLAEESQYAEFDSVPVEGSKLITAMRRYSNKDNFYIYVQKSPSERFIANPARNSSTCFQVDFNRGQLLTSTTNNCTVTVNEMLDESSPYFIAPQGDYRATRLIDLNDRTAGLLFIKQ